jgi:DNA-binding MarR family transcriptional regulator
MSYKLEWNNQKNKLTKYRELLSFFQAVTSARVEEPALKNYNQHLVTTALVHASILGFNCDKTSLAAYTSLPRTSLNNTLNALEKQNYIIFQNDENDKRRIFVKPTKTLIDQYFNWMNQSIDLLETLKKNTL